MSQKERSTPPLNLPAVLNQSLACPACHKKATWRRTSKARRRENSLIDFLECSQCGQRIVAKLPLVPGSALGDRQRAEAEHRTLLQLHSLFPQSDTYGTLVPVACLDESGIFVSLRFEGHNLSRRLRESRLAGSPDYARHAGAWLRKLHDACPRGYAKQLLGVNDRVHYLQSRYGAAIAREPVARMACERLIETGKELKAAMFRSSWGHGDFKPENLLFDGHKYVGIDTLLEHRSAVMYDLASFLDHLLLAGRTVPWRPVGGSFAQANEQFLDGYGDLDSSDIHAVRWLQLYFLLCYWGRSQGRGRLRATYGDWQLLPLLREADAHLSRGVS